MSDSLNTHFMSRKLHSLTGFLPIGAFLMFHLWENSMSRKGAAYFNEHVVQGIENLLNYKLAIELFLALTILFHGIYGVVIWWQGKSNASRYANCSNWRYLAQRLTAFTTFAFIVWHVWNTRILAEFDPVVAGNLFAHMQRLYSSPWTVACYMLGITGATFHLANGLWLMAINWGFTTHVRAQKWFAWACGGIFAVLTFIGFHALWGFNGRFF